MSNTKNATKEEAEHVEDGSHPLAGLTQEELMDAGERYAHSHGMVEHVADFRKGAALALDKSAYNIQTATYLDAEEKTQLLREHKSKWDQPWTLYTMVVMGSLAAAVQGMDQTVINGANLFFRETLGIPKIEGNERNEWLLGLVNSSPYFGCAFVACWLTDPLNRYLGRRGTIFTTCFIAGAACIWQAFCNTWWHLMIARFVMAFGIGPKSGTVPMYTSECAPDNIRGALTMMWQMWTAFGIMCGLLADVALYNVSSPTIDGLNWRLMLGSACIPPIIVCLLVFFSPESPRWYLKKDRHRDAFNSLVRMRTHRIQAARDLFLMVTFHAIEPKCETNRLLEIFTVPRNRRGMLASQIVMFMQQFCGINVIAYYSSVIFIEGGFSEKNALLTSMGFGMVNFLFAIPAIYTIDRFGRRSLLLSTFPLMAIFLVMTGCGFWIENTQTKIAVIAAGVYLHGAVYSPGEGPVPFTYSAEAYPLYVKELGMSLATATTWFFNGVLSITWPRMQQAFTNQGAFLYYAGWNVVGFFLVLFFVPETKSRSLEELNQVFSIPTRRHAAYGWRQLKHFFKRLFGVRSDPESLDSLFENTPEVGAVVQRMLKDDASEERVEKA